MTMPANDPRTHFLKTHPEFFQAVVDKRKTFEVRVNDRDFRMGDVLILREWAPPVADQVGGYTGRQSTPLVVTYVMHGGKLGLDVGWVVLGFVES